MADRVSRRRLLGGIGTASAIALAGCSGMFSGPEKPAAVQGEAHWNFDEVDPDEFPVVIKLNDKWWHLHRDPARLEEVEDNDE